MAVTNQLTDIKLEILSRCPLRCIHCSSESSSDCDGFVTPSQVEKLIREFVMLDGKQVEVSGGEPLEHPDLLDILDIIRAENISTTIYTSGIRISKEGNITPIDGSLAIALKRHIRSIVFSLQAGEASIHDSFTGIPGSFEATLTAINACQTSGIDVNLHFVPTQANFNSLPSLISLMKKRQIRRISLLRFVPHGRGAGRSLALNSQQHNALKNMVDNLITEKEVRVRLGSPFSILQSVEVPACRAGIESNADRSRWHCISL